MCCYTRFIGLKAKAPSLVLISVLTFGAAVLFYSNLSVSGATHQDFPTTDTGRYSLQEDASQVYQRTCRECHGDSANQRFYQRLSEAELIQTILKGRMMEKPPDMPAFEEKGVTAEQARELALFMQELRKQSTKD